MKFGFNFLLWTTFVTDEQLPKFALLKEVGYDGIEIPVGDGPVSHYRDLAPKIRDHGLEVTTVAMGLPDADPSSSDPTIRYRLSGISQGEASRGVPSSAGVDSCPHACGAGCWTSSGSLLKPSYSGRDTA